MNKLLKWQDSCHIFHMKKWRQEKDKSLAQSSLVFTTSAMRSFAQWLKTKHTTKAQKAGRQASWTRSDEPGYISKRLQTNVFPSVNFGLVQMERWSFENYTLSSQGMKYNSWVKKKKKKTKQRKVCVSQLSGSPRFLQRNTARPHDPDQERPQPVLSLRGSHVAGQRAPHN